MSEANKINLSINGGNVKKSVRPTTLEQVLKWIDSLKYDTFTTKELKKTVSKYPCGTYHKFKLDIQNHLTRIYNNKKSKEESEE